MENRAHAIVAVVFLLVFTLGAVVVYYWLAGRRGESVTYEIATGLSVDGLSRQSEVRFKGLVVGYISRIGFDPADRSRVLMRLQLRPDTYVTHATYAEVAMQGLTGGSVLELKLGAGSRAPLATSTAHPALIPMRAGLLATLETSATQDLQDLHAVLASAKQLLDRDNREHVAATLKQLDAVTRQLAAVEKQLPGLLAGVQHSVDQSHALLANANELVRAAQAPVRNAAALETSIEALALSTRQLGERLDRQSVPDFDALGQSLLRSSRQLEQLLRELQAKPQSLIFGPPKPPPGPGEPGFHAGGRHEEHPR
ncbi:MAG TPA: MlaD family protein [Rhodanobacteraceae bacterium]|nr:MlaD family protein [Rhodanobacteraceae bacterium]